MGWEIIVPIGLIGFAALWAVLVLRGGAGG
jgi:hypothetical protein